MSLIKILICLYSVFGYLKFTENAPVSKVKLMEGPDTTDGAFETTTSSQWEETTPSPLYTCPEFYGDFRVYYEPWCTIDPSQVNNGCQCNAGSLGQNCRYCESNFDCGENLQNNTLTNIPCFTTYKSQNVVVFGSEEGIVQFYLGETQTLVANYSYHTGSVEFLLPVALANQSFVVSASADYTIIIWDANSWQYLGKYTGHTQAVESLEYLDSDSLMVSGSLDNTIQFWNIQTKLLSFQWNISEYGAAWSLKAIPNNNSAKLASGHNSGKILIWTVSEEKNPLQVLDGHSDVVFDLKIIGNTRLASASWDSTIIIWNLNDYSLNKTLEGHKNKVFTLLQLKNDQHNILLSASADDTVIMWNLNDLTKLVDYTSNTAGIYRALGLYNSTIILSGSKLDDTLRAWSISGSEAVGVIFSLNTGLNITTVAVANPFEIATTTTKKTTEATTSLFKRCRTRTTVPTTRDL